MTKRNPNFGEPLAERELEVLYGMAMGLRNKEIGKQLFLSEATVKTHARRLFAKLAVPDRTSAVIEGFRLGLVTCPCRKAVAS